MRSAALLAAVVSAALVAAFVSARACSRAAEASGEESEEQGRETLAKSAKDPWVGESLSAFSLVERSGRAVKLSDLSGHPFVLDFVFTTCSGPCPKLSTNMERLQTELAGSPTRLVSISVDPARDTPEVLSAYAERFHADRERWLFLTGDESEIAAVARSAQLALEAAPGAPPGAQVTHATRLVVVDGQGRVRGYYDGLSDGGLAAAAARARFLDREGR